MKKYICKIANRTMLFAFLGGLLSGLLFDYARHGSVAQDVYVDVDKVITAIGSDIASNSGNLQNIGLLMESYKAKFLQEVEDYSEQHQVKVFSSPKPIAGAEDKTDYFIKRVLNYKNKVRNE